MDLIILRVLLGIAEVADHGSSLYFAERPVSGYMLGRADESFEKSSP